MKIIYSLCIGLALIFGLLANRAIAQNVSDYQSLPPFIESSNTPPVVMLTMSVDFKTYNDFYDIDGDDRADMTYNKSIQYIGYFDSEMCYEYNRDVFVPNSKTTSDFYCNQGLKRDQWSGNFLNWLLMTPIDVVRKISYGGLRSVDNSDKAILERNHLPNDAHSFAKHYNGRDLGKLTPFWNMRTGDSHQDNGITFCNTSIGSTVGTRLQHSTAIPLIRAARGNHSFWPAGEPKPDDLPDNYYDANNPLQLKIQFAKVLERNLEGAPSGTGSKVVTNAGDDTGLFIQSLFYPSLTSGEQKLTWVSTLNGLFMDENNQVREDSNSNGALDDSDAIVAVEYEPERKVMMAQRYAIGTDGKRGGKQGDLIPINQIKGLWNAESALAGVKDYKNQRDYATSASAGRYLFTAIDGDNDGITDAGDSVTFTQSAFAGKSHLLHANNDVALNIIDYIRGTDLPGMRPRMGDVISGNATLEPWLLGDIANASPVIVGAPKLNYDIEYSDNTYAAYRKHYRDRRNMVYAAANDGVLHAFNAGFYDPTKKQFRTDKHPLGSELWGYIPYNLLGHLQWLTDYNYPHVAYLDGQLKSFDVNIFKADEDHPYGWGTILVAGMRFGGGTIEMPKNNSDNNPARMRSAWVVLDVTNPEKPPKLIAEVTDDQLGFTTTNVDIVKRRAPSYSNGKYEQPAFNQWYLAFGSGPFGLGGPQSRTAQTTATSTQNAQLFLFDLQNKKLKRFASSAANSFVGGITVTDWNRDYIDDVIYFGTVGGSQSAPRGQLLRATLTLNSTGAAMTFSPVLDVTNQPFSAPPMTRIDNQFNYWVFAGTGRYFNDADSKLQVSNSFYGVKESKDALGALPTTAQSKSKLIDVSNIQTYTNGEIRTLSSGQVFINGSEPIKNSTQMTSAVADASGWFINFTEPGSRNVGPASMHLSSLMFTAFAPSTDTCSGKVGSTQLYQRDFFNGLSPKYSAYTDDDKTIGTDDDVSEAIDTVIELGDNYFIEPNEEGLSQSNEGELKEIDLGTPNIKSRRESWREVLKDW